MWESGPLNQYALRPFQYAITPSKPLCSEFKSCNAPATEIMIIWEKSGHYTQNDHIHRACAHWPSQGNVSPEGGPWFKPSALGPCSHCLPVCVSHFSPPLGLNQWLLLTIYDRAEAECILYPGLILSQS